ncbi:MAG TPA: hypothetical protein PKG54_08875 [Phycisphaerae bacterium]|jgi:hypothetical protein|nr:hypothetical protein [Phycisphaerae bacterium]HOB74628.1 hypothetical protein [Phycisphaerae bacterium]HOJ53583.1 hypothetical protein [Phycisphaerae bacterium]HOL25260.1 hypothetical protein [Phycisphaerae bacterium]HPP20525.1 hypothetical protein [Phycisphaerae bacterium]
MRYHFRTWHAPVCVAVVTLLTPEPWKATGPASCRAETVRTDLVFACGANNDLYRALAASGVTCPRYDTPGMAVKEAPAGAAVLILAEGYPLTPTGIDADLFEQAAKAGIQLYIEYPANVPGLRIDPPRKTQWERVVVSTDAFDPALPRLRILMVHGCHFTPTEAADPLLVVGRVAGFDRAVFGLPKEHYPILFEIPDRRLVIATTRLSSFVTGRYAPTKDWQVFWERMLGRLTGGAPVKLKVMPTVRPAYGPDEPLPPDAEKRSLAALTRWVVDAGLLVHASKEAELHKLMRAGQSFGPALGGPVGNGRHGLLEGFDSAIAHDGSQRQIRALRSDCHAETAACMALDWVVNHNEQSRRIAENLLDYVCFTSDAMRGPRGNPEHPAFGHVAWGVVAPAWWIANYGDDNGRVIQATILAAACLESDRWDEPMLRALLANLRTTGKFGFRGERIDIRPLEQHGWKHFQEAGTVFFSPHYEASMWTCYLWAYRHTRYAPFLEKSKIAIRKTMEAYPDRWLWRNNLERVRMIHCLAWLVRVEDTPEHRGWLKRMCGDLLACQDPDTGAITEVIGTTGQAHFLPPTSNEEYGTREMPIIQDNTDRASDQLYVTGFSLLVLREAAAVLNDPELKAAEDKLAAYLCRIQIRADDQPALNGGWFRAFDVKRWEYWASSGDAGWGAWSLEAGWGQAWGAATMGLRALNTTLWDLTANSKIAVHLPAVQQLMAVNKGGPWPPATQPAAK